MLGDVANRYAQALFELAKDNGALTSFEDELAFVSRIFKQTPEFLEFLTHPKISRDEKKRWIEDAFSKAVSQFVINFIKLLVDRGREQYFQPIYDRYVELVNTELGRVQVHVESAFALTEDDLLDIGTKLHSYCGKVVNLTTSVNESLIGGVRLRVGDKLIDASIKGQLNQFRQSLQRLQVR